MRITLPTTPRRRVFAASVAVAFTACWTAVGVSMPASADPGQSDAPPVISPARPLPLPPELDPGFYHQPPEVLAATAPGGIIAARQVTLANFSVFPLNVDAWQVAYRSNNSRDEPISAVATLIKPRGVAPEPRKLLSMQLAEDSTAGYCTPSYGLQHLSLSALGGQLDVPGEFILAQGALQQGWALVIPDHQGPESAFAAGPLAARITLDGIRAATSFAPLEVGPTAPVGMYGYSGGSIPTVHAAELHPSYAPELNIKGAAAGGVGADLGMAVDLANGQATSGVVLAAVLGLSREYPEFEAFLEEKMDPVGRTLLAAKAPLCVQYQGAVLPFLNIKGMMRTPGDPLREPVVAAMLDETRMGSELPDMPMFLWHSALDEVLPLAATDQLVDSYCRNPDATVRYTRDHLSEHVIAGIAGFPSAMLWLRDRLNEVPVDAGCSVQDVPSMVGDAEQQAYFASVVGETVAALFGKAIGAR